MFLSDYRNRDLRLPKERLKHIKSRKEMRDQEEKIKETVKAPDQVRKSNKDPSVHLYYKKYPKTPVTEKYLLVVAKVDSKSPFIITSFFTDKIKSGELIYHMKDS